MHRRADGGVELLRITFHHFFSEPAEKYQCARGDRECGEQKNTDCELIGFGFAIGHMSCERRKCECALEILDGDAPENPKGGANAMAGFYMKDGGREARREGRACAG